MSGEKKLLQMSGIEKSFNGVRVLKKVDLDVVPGEVHALMGENGAGKSTLIKILTGVYPKDGGTMMFNGKECEIHSRQDAARLGIGVIYQELSLIPTLSIAQNVMLGKERSRCGVLIAKQMQQKVKALIEEYDFRLNPDAVVETLSIAQRQTVEILKALSEDSSLIIMDEPTASLSSKESEALFEIINQLRKKGVSVLYISHRLEEVFRLSDRLTVLRDGQKVDTLTKEQINPADVVRMMIGKEVSEATASRPLSTAKSEIVLEVKHLTRKGVFQDINFCLHRGEILGMGGLVGAGRSEVIRCIYGADPYDSGEVFFHGKKLSGSIRKHIAEGFGLIPEDRRNQGFVPLLSVGRNLALTNYDVLAKASLVKQKEEKQMGIEIVRKLDIRPANDMVPVGNLSGGNQQKVVLGKWLARDLNVLLVDEPTAGIDIGAKNEIYKLLEGLAAQGVSILLVSSDLQELLRVSHRILVLRKGKLCGEFNNGVITQEDILMAASGIQEGHGKEVGCYEEI